MTSYCQYTPDKKEQSTQNQTKICAIIVFYVYFVLYIELLFGDVGLNGSLKSKILNEITVSIYGAITLELGTDCIVEAVTLPVNNYIVIPFNVPPLWYGIICKNEPKYPIVTGVTIPEGTTVYYRNIN